MASILQKGKDLYAGLDGDGKVAVVSLLVFLAFSIVTIHFGPTPLNLVDNPNIDSGDTAWLLASTALVLLMTPGLAFFYGGMVRSTSILYTMFQSLAAMAGVTIVWTFIGFSLAFGEDVGGVIGNPATYFTYRHVGAEPNPELAATIPLGLFSIFHLKFAIIAPALVSGAFTERISLGPYCIYMLLFCVFIYCPLAHAVWHPKGFLRVWGVLDFAGGTVVETSTGWSALAGAIVFNQGKKSNHTPAVKHHPHIPYIVLGTSLLWFGWFGFNSGSALKADGLAMQSFLNTHVAGAAGMISWMLVEKIRGLKPSVTGACVGAVVGMVIITPACGFVSTGGAFICGIVGGMCCNVACSLVAKATRLDDQLEVFPAHGLGGTIGTILTGCLADKNVNPMGGWGLFYGGYDVFYKNLVAAILSAVYSCAMSYAILKGIGYFMPLFVDGQYDDALDASLHGETVVLMTEKQAAGFAAHDDNDDARHHKVLMMVSKQLESETKDVEMVMSKGEEAT